MPHFEWAYSDSSDREQQGAWHAGLWLITSHSRPYARHSLGLCPSR